MSPLWPTGNTAANTRVTAVYGTPLTRSVVEGEAYRVSKRYSLDDGQELIVHFDPVVAGGTIHIETPAIDNPEACDIDVYENADPQTNLVDDLFVHNMRYDGQEQPEATIQRVSDQGLDTSGDADQTEQTRVRSGGDYNTPGGESQRGLWRTIPVGETVSFVITDQSGGTANTYGFDTVVHEGDALPD